MPNTTTGVAPVTMGHPVMTDNAGETTMLKKIAYAGVFVSDQDRALDFYTNVLGFEKRIESPAADGSRFLTIGVEGQDFELVLWPGTPGRGKPALGAPAAQYTMDTDDCRTAFESLKSRGVKFEPPEVIEQPWGLIARFQDLDGNVLQLRELRLASGQR
jgi:catechol 2,3-dioxygenase-like lactoylglutathione lyase family enzyme